MKDVEEDSVTIDNTTTEDVIEFNHAHLPDPWLEVILLSVLPGIIISSLFWLFINDLGSSISLGFGIWGFVYFKKLKSKLWVSVDSDQEMVIQNRFKKPTELESAENITDPCYIPKGLRSVGAGLHPLTLGESVVAVIDTTTPIPITAEILDVLDMDKLSWNVTAKMTTTPLRGRWSARSIFVNSDASEAFFKSLLDTVVRQGFAKTGGWEASRFKEDFTRENFVKILGGTGKIVSQEIQYARNAGLPFIDKIESTKTTEEILNKVRSARSTRDAINILKRAGVSTETASAIASGQKVNFVSLMGASANSPVAQAVVAESIEKGSK